MNRLSAPTALVLDLRNPLREDAAQTPRREPCVCVCVCVFAVTGLYALRALRLLRAPASPAREVQQQLSSKTPQAGSFIPCPNPSARKRLQDHIRHLNYLLVIEKMDRQKERERAEKMRKAAEALEKEHLEAPMKKRIQQLLELNEQLQGKLLMKEEETEGLRKMWEAEKKEVEKIWNYRMRSAPKIWR
ncbi:hypothetical protein MHYP_G00179500 [Metynnis hypsauchen]